MSEHKLLDYLLGRADEPCAKSVPSKLNSVIKSVWQKIGLDPIVGPLAEGQAKRLKSILACNQLQSVRKALNPLLLMVVAMELALAAPESAPDLSGADRALIGAELVKIYTCARWHDIENLVGGKCALHNTYWGGVEHPRGLKPPGRTRT